MKRPVLRRRLQAEQSAVSQVIVSVLAGLAALVIPVALIAGLGKPPLQTLAVLLTGAFGSASVIEMTLLKLAPLLTAALGTSLAFQAGIWNIGNLGQFVVGAIGSSVVALALGDVPGAWMLALISGCIAGALWALIPGLMRALLSINEVVTTLLMNYIGVLLLDFLLNGPLKNKATGLPQTPRFAASATLPLTTADSRVHIGVFLALLLVACVYLLVFRTSLGFELRCVGKNPAGARYGGISLQRTIVIAFLLSGALSGLAGAGEALGLHHKLLNGIASGYEYTPIVVALLGGLNPMGMVFAAVLFGGLLVGARSMQIEAGLPTSFVFAIQALIVLFVIGARALQDWRLAWSNSKPTTAPSLGPAPQQREAGP